MNTQSAPASASQTPAHPSGRVAGPVRVRVVSIGDELLSGDTVNTNATFLGTACRELGATLEHVATVRDRHEEIVSAVREHAAAADVCLVSGGLGPTTDDLTTAALADAAGVVVQRDPDALARLEAKFRAFGYTDMPVSNHKQADFPAGAKILPNPIGSAEGFEVEVNTCPVFVMPGVPREMRRMFSEEIAPRLQERFTLRPTLRRMYRTLGRGESSLAKLVEPIVDEARSRSPGLASVFLHYRASTPEVIVLLEATPDAHGQAATAGELQSLDEALGAAMSPALYGIGDTELAVRVLAWMRAAGLTLAVAESCTGGGLGRRLVANPGASDVFVGGVVAYANGVKQRALGVPAALLETHGAVSEPVAQAMSEGGRRQLGADLCVAITGIAGPGGGTPSKPVGTVHIDVFDGEAHLHKQLHLRGNRGTVQHCAELWALKLVWDSLCARGLATVELPTPSPNKPRPSDPSENVRQDLS